MFAHIHLVTKHIKISIFCINLYKHKNRSDYDTYDAVNYFLLLKILPITMNRMQALAEFSLNTHPL